MKTQVKELEYSTAEAEEKIRKYGRIRNGLFTMGIVGFISAVSSIPIFQEYNKPEIAETYQDAETTIQELQHRRKNLKNKLESFSYTTPEIEEARNFFNKEYDEGVFRLDKAIKSVEVEVSKIESNSEYKQYQQNKKSRKPAFSCLYFGGLLTSLGGVVGSAIVEKQKRNLEAKLQNENLGQPKNQRPESDKLQKKYLKELNAHL